MLNGDETRNPNHPESTVETNWLPTAEAVYYQVSLNPFLKVTITKKRVERTSATLFVQVPLHSDEQGYFFRIEVI